MSTGILVTVITAVLGSGGLATIITAFVNSKRNRSQSETEARAQFSDEFNVLAKNLSDEIKRQDGRIDILDQKVLRLERRETSFRAYISTLIAQVRGLGAEPVDTPPNLEL